MPPVPPSCSPSAADAGNLGDSLRRHSICLQVIGALGFAALVGGAGPTYALTSGQHLDMSVDGGAADVATFTASAAYDTATSAGTFAFNPADAFDVTIDSGLAETVTIAGTAAYETATSAGTFAFADADAFDVSIDGGAAQTVTMLAINVVAIGAVTPAELATEINGQTVGCTAVGGATNVVVTSATFGTGSRVVINNGVPGGVLAALALSGEVVGTGTAANLAATTPAELRDAINAQTVRCTAAIQAVTGVRVTSDLLGTDSRVVIDNGAPIGVIAALALSGETVGAGNVADISAVTRAEVKTIVELAAAAVTVTVSTFTLSVVAPSTLEITGASTAAVALGFAVGVADTAPIGAIEGRLYVPFDGRIVGVSSFRRTPASGGGEGGSTAVGASLNGTSVVAAAMAHDYADGASTRSVGTLDPAHPARDGYGIAVSAGDYLEASVDGVETGAVGPAGLTVQFDLLIG